MAAEQSPSRVLLSLCVCVCVCGVSLSLSREKGRQVNTVSSDVNVVERSVLDPGAISVNFPIAKSWNRAGARRDGRKQVIRLPAE